MNYMPKKLLIRFCLELNLHLKARSPFNLILILFKINLELTIKVVNSFYRPMEKNNHQNMTLEKNF